MSTSASPLMELREVSRRFGTQEVLRDVSLGVYPRETLVVIGESGCGKSVTMKVLMKLLEPSSGTVLWDGKPLAGRMEQEIVKERLQYGYLFQGAALFDSLSVFENVAFALRQNTTLLEDEIEVIVRLRLHDVGLNADTVAGKMPSQLSGGMRKRVGLARALALDPKVMLYDEPTTGLDPIMSDVINELIIRTRENRGVASIVVTHDMHTVRKVADRVVMLYPVSRLAPDDDQIIFEGTADDAFDHGDPRVAQFVRGEAGERLTELMAA